MTRKTYGGYSITELRRLAREAGIKGRSGMGGWNLLINLHRYWREQVVQQEQAVLSVTTVEPGTILRYKSTGTIVRATSGLFPYAQDGVNYESLCFTAEYVEVGASELHGAWVGRGVEYAQTLNEHRVRTREYNERHGYGHLGLRHMLYQCEPVTR